MPIIQGPNTTLSTEEITYWGLAKFAAGQKNVTELHFHDCDEYVFMICGRMILRSEGEIFTLEAGDVQVTRMGDEHELLEIIEDTTYFWCETQLRGLKRPGHLHRGQHEPSPA